MKEFYSSNHFDFFGLILQEISNQLLFPYLCHSLHSLQELEGILYYKEQMQRWVSCNEQQNQSFAFHGRG